MTNFRERANFNWNIANLVRASLRQGKYRDVILPFTVLRRVVSVLKPTKQVVLSAYHKYKDKLLNDPDGLADNLMNYINRFSDNMGLVLYNFDFENTILKLDDQGL